MFPILATDNSLRDFIGLKMTSKTTLVETCSFVHSSFRNRKLLKLLTMDQIAWTYAPRQAKMQST